MSAPTIAVADVVRAAERSAQRRPRLGSDATRLLIEALWCRLPLLLVSPVAIRREMLSVAALQRWYLDPARTGQELRGLLVELAVVAADGEPNVEARWLDALGVEIEPTEARAA